jgi:hypothetical protein
VTAALRVTLAALVLATGFAACGQGSCSFPPVKASPAEGIVVAVDSTGLTDVRSFSLRQSDGSTVFFQVGQLDNATAFPPGHLKEHQASASPIRVWFTVRNRLDLIAYRLEDATDVPATEQPVSFSCG